MEGENIIVCSYLIHKSKGRFVHLCSKGCKIPTKQPKILFRIANEGAQTNQRPDGKRTPAH